MIGKHAMMQRIGLIAILAVMVPLAPVHAQAGSDGSRPVVQPLPSPAVGQLNAALRRISRNARDVEALTDAGFASLRLDDVEAAVGFFTRAQEVQPGNARVKLGLASAYLRSDRPVEAIQLYREAEQAGASSQEMAADRGLAYDLVGDNAAAQQEYARALTGANADEVRRRLALSQAIQGNREAFERTLYPLLEKQDFAAYRARAFALAILGEEKEAIAITEAVMPADLAARIEPYLNFMRRLTPAQQAAAANLGNFPRAAQIGRDDPRIVAYRAETGGVRTADAALAPSGPTLGTQAPPAQARADTASQRRRPGRGSTRVEEQPAAPATTAPAVAASAPAPAPPVQTPAPAVVARGPTPQELPPVSSAAAVPVAAAPATTTTLVSTTPAPATPAPAAPPTAAPVVETLAAAPSAPATVVPTGAPQPGFDLARAGGSPAPILPATVSPPVSAPVSAPAPEPAPPPAARVADAFADLAAPATPDASRPAHAVDITRIKPPREVEKKPEPPAAKPPAAKPPPPPPVPARHWVQLATGRDKAALKFDWRRFAGKAPDVLGKMEPHVTPWGQANRLLAGPYDSPRAANTALAALKKAGLDGFVFTSETGQEVERLR